jgi:hypothetical protein
MQELETEIISQRWGTPVFDNDSETYDENSDEIDEEEIDLSEQPLIPMIVRQVPAVVQKNRGVDDHNSP